MKVPLAGLLLVVLTAGNCQSQDAVKQLVAATNEVEKTLASLNISGELAQQCANDVRVARNSLASGNLYLSLNTIRSCWLELRVRNFAASKSDKRNDTTAFETDWRQLEAVLKEKEELLVKQSSRSLPALAIALAEASQIQARPYYVSGRLYGLNSSIADGYYYLGRAPANLDFALFCRQLKFTRIRTPIKLRTLAAELAKLESETLAAYRGSDVSSQQGQYNRLNSNLKLASELNAAGMFAGALNKYLESILYLGLIRSNSAERDLQLLRAKRAEIGRQLAMGDSDHSIGLLYWQMAENVLKGTGTPTESDIKRAFVLLNNVLPSYFDYIGKTKQ